MIKPDDVRSAREFLRKRGVRGLSPRKFAHASDEAGLSYSKLLTSLGGLARRKIDANAK